MKVQTASMWVTDGTHHGRHRFGEANGSSNQTLARLVADQRVKSMNATRRHIKKLHTAMWVVGFLSVLVYGRY